MSWPATAPAPSWPCRPTTSATWNSPANSICPSAWSCRRPKAQESIGFVGDGVSVNSGFLTGLPTPEAKKKITAWLEEKGWAAKPSTTNCATGFSAASAIGASRSPSSGSAAGGVYHEALPESALPLLPPELTDFKPTSTGEPPLARAKDWVRLPDGSTRETNTMPQWAGSCWYYLRFTDARNSRAILRHGGRALLDDRARTAVRRKLMAAPPRTGVDLYVGGIEHAVLHLLYARFWHKVLFDLGYVSTPEPFYKLVNQGLILGEDGQKMSKSRGNVVNPDDILREYGADAFRLYEMFMGPLEMVKPWNTAGVEGVYRFLGRVWRLFVDEHSETEFEQAQTAQPGGRPASALERIQLSAGCQECRAHRRPAQDPAHLHQKSHRRPGRLCASTPPSPP